MTDFQAVDLDAVLDQFEFHEEEKEEQKKKQKESFDELSLAKTSQPFDQTSQVTIDKNDVRESSSTVDLESSKASNELIAEQVFLFCLFCFVLFCSFV